MPDKIDIRQSPEFRKWYIGMYPVQTESGTFDMVFPNADWAGSQSGGGSNPSYPSNGSFWDSDLYKAQLLETASFLRYEDYLSWWMSQCNPCCYDIEMSPYGL